MQYHQHELLSFCSLAQYQLYQSQDHVNNTPKALQIKHYLDFADSKRVVLMRGEIDPTQIDAMEAQLLVNQMQLYYLDSVNFELVRKFNEEPSKFDYKELLSLRLPQ
eukprot:TRINITY_DN1491_c0_g2_i8.p2 TRINITY_DN1491_c0_g2~~TRINITY_DN1491_c0_g2_i8.p2  ORF type:complete len:107 (-),score=16.36 TRINITY_DN1491_c0_g2_i8:106-426(-)